MAPDENAVRASKCIRAERLFTLSDVENLRKEALKKLEEELRYEYDQKLAKCMQEQFVVFSQYNEHYHRTKSTDFSYLV